MGVQLKARMCDGDCSYETFRIDQKREPNRWTEKKEKLIFECCKTAFRPYDLAVQAALIIAAHHLGEAIVVSSDGTSEQWDEARLLCQMELGYGQGFTLED